MLFNSYIFIFLFLPITLLVWYILNRYEAYKSAQAFLLVVSLYFYGYFNYSYLLIILGSIAFNYIISRLFEITGSVKDITNKTLIYAKALKAVGILFNLVLIGIFKYYNFFIDNVNYAFRLSMPVKDILLPLGISFFTFQQLSFVLDRANGEAPSYSFLDYSSFVSFFPQLIAGPILLHNELIPQFQDKLNKKFNIDNFTNGIERFIIGLGKKVILADYLGLVVNKGFSSVYYLTTSGTIIMMLCYALELYLDFSGYSDMAIGIGKMFNINIVENFDSPYKAINMKDLWQRWHLTLTRFLFKYVYIPLGGSRNGKKRINIILVFIVSGIWHGAGWNYIVWGLLSGVAVAISGDIDKYNNVNRIKYRIRQLGTFIFFCITLIFFRSKDMAQALQVFRGLFNIRGIKIVQDMAMALDVAELYALDKFASLYAPNMIPVIYLIALVIIITISLLVVTGPKAGVIIAKEYKSRLYTFSLGIIFVWSVISLSGVNTFLYFNF